MNVLTLDTIINTVSGENEITFDEKTSNTSMLHDDALQ